MLGKKYCKDGCDYTRLTESQLHELGLKSWGSSRPSYRSDMIDRNSCIAAANEFRNESKKGTITLFHGTSIDNATEIIKNGFKPYTGTLGRGIYFSPMYKPYRDIPLESSINYARKYDDGTIIAIRIPSSSIITSKKLWKTGKEELARSINKLQQKVPDQVEDFFNQEGSMFDTPEQLHAAYDKLGGDVMSFALKNNIRAWDDGIQTIVYDGKWLKRLETKELEECRTLPMVK